MFKGTGCEFINSFGANEDNMFRENNNVFEKNPYYNYKKTLSSLTQKSVSIPSQNSVFPSIIMDLRLHLLCNESNSIICTKKCSNRHRLSTILIHKKLKYKVSKSHHKKVERISKGKIPLRTSTSICEKSMIEVFGQIFCFIF